MFNTNNTNNTNNIVNDFVEVSKNSNLKYEYNPNDKQLQLDRILPYKFNYPFNYGFIVNTVGGDGDPLDVVILLDEPLIQGTNIKCKIIGALKYIDEKGQDDKLIVCPANNVDTRFIHINDISNIKYETLNKIRYFFDNYKSNLNIKVTTGHFLNSKQAIKLYENRKI